MYLVKVYSNTCIPCKMLSPLIDKLKIQTGVEVVEIDSQKEIEFIQRHNIRSNPTLILFDEDDQEIRRHVGLLTYEQLEEFINGKI